MSSSVMIFDYYTYRARLLPGFIALAPVAILLYVFFPNSTALWPTWTSLVAALGLTFLLTEIVRERGKKLERKLISDWGGLPSVLIMKYDSTWIDKGTLERRRQRIGKLIGTPLLDELSEAGDPEVADKMLNSCNSYLLSQTRDQKKFYLLFKQNVSYGFRRNLLGLKPLACSLLLIVAVVLFFFERAQGFPFEPSAVLASLILLAIASIWLLYINASWVRSAADAYALQLCEAIDRL